MWHWEDKTFVNKNTSTWKTKVTTFFNNICQKLRFFTIRQTNSEKIDCREANSQVLIKRIGEARVPWRSGALQSITCPMYISSICPMYICCLQCETCVPCVSAVLDSKSFERDKIYRLVLLCCPGQLNRDPMTNWGALTGKTKPTKFLFYPQTNQLTHFWPPNHKLKACGYSFQKRYDDPWSKNALYVQRRHHSENL